MSDSKKYYYLKLKENFFESEEMIILQNMTDGYLYSDILMKLYLRSLKNNGKLMFKELIPYTPSVLAQVLRHQVGTVEKAMQIFQSLGLIEVLDNGAIYMSDIQNFIGKSTTEADRKREYRKKIESELRMLGQGSDKCPDKSPPEIEVDKEIDIELEKKKDVELEAEKEEQSLEELYNYCEKKGFALTDNAKENIENFINEGRETKLIKYAVNEAIENKINKWCYVQTILNRYRHEDMKTYQEAVNEKVQKMNDKLPLYSKKQLESFYNI